SFVGRVLAPACIASSREAKCSALRDPETGRHCSARGDMLTSEGQYLQRRLFLRYDKYPPSLTSASITRHHAHAPEVRSLMSTCMTVFAPYSAFIPDFPAFCAALQTPRPCCLRVNTLRTTPGVVRELLMSQGYSVTPSPIADELLLVPNLTHPG